MWNVTQIVTVTQIPQTQHITGSKQKQVPIYCFSTLTCQLFQFQWLLHHLQCVSKMINTGSAGQC